MTPAEFADWQMHCQPLTPACQRCGQTGTMHYEPGCHWAACLCEQPASLVLPEWAPRLLVTAWRALNFERRMTAAKKVAQMPERKGPPLVVPRSGNRGAPAEDLQMTLL